MRLQLMILAQFMAISLSLISQEPSGWIAVFGNDRIKDNLSFYYEGQYRNHNLFNQRNQILLRGGVGWSLTENNNKLLLGYGFINSKDEICYSIDATAEERDLLMVDEHRIFQQFITKNSANRLLLKHRIRFEQRFFDADFSLRFRYFSNLILPLNATQVAKNVSYFSIYNEIFLNFKDNYFDRNRIYGGFGYAVTNDFKIELGYMNQFLNGLGNHTVMLTVFNNMDFKFFSL